MAWYDGMTEAEIKDAIHSGKAPGSATAGGWIEVPSWYMRRLAFDVQEDKNMQRMAKMVESIREPLRESIAINLEQMADRIVDINGKSMHASSALRAAARRVRAREWDK